MGREVGKGEGRRRKGEEREGEREGGEKGEGGMEDWGRGNGKTQNKGRSGEAFFPALQFRFLSYLQGELPSYWLRYSEGVVLEMIEATATLLSCSYSNPGMLGPVHYMALFDPKATWFRKWTVSAL